MIYFDNSATTLQKPETVLRAVQEALCTFGNPGRSFCNPAMQAGRAVFHARSEIARLAGLANPMGVAFTSGATESLNLVLGALLSPQDGVITTVLEHNSVLRPLYRMGCPLAFVDCDDEGALRLDMLESLLDTHTRAVVCTHGSNLLGSVTNVAAVAEFCKKNRLYFVLDVSQTLGCVETRADMADVLCFTGHKALFGPQGTGGIIASGELPFRLVKTGGTGSESFERTQPLRMPDIFEAGTHNAHGLAGLRAGAAFVNETGVPAIARKGQALTTRFLCGLAGIPGVRVYGSGDAGARLPVVALNVGGLPAGEVALRLWEEWEIATRAGSHCAPLAHKRFGTAERGMVRFSFSCFNTEDEIDTALQALRQIAAA